MRVPHSTIQSISSSSCSIPPQLQLHSLPLSQHQHTHTHTHITTYVLSSFSLPRTLCLPVLTFSSIQHFSRNLSHTYTHTHTLSLSFSLCMSVCVCVIPYPTQGHHHQPFVVVFPSLTSTQSLSLSLSHSLSVYSKYNHVCIYLTLSHNNSQIHASPTTPLNHFAFVRCTLSRLQFSLPLSEISSLRLSPVSRLGIQNPARERMNYSKSSKKEKELFKIQQESE